MFTVQEEIAFLKARSLQTILPQSVKGAVYIRADREAIRVTIRTEELGDFGVIFTDCIDLTACDMARIVEMRYREYIARKFFR